MMPRRDAINMRNVKTDANKAVRHTASQSSVLNKRAVHSKITLRVQWGKHINQQRECLLRATLFSLQLYC